MSETTLLEVKNITVTSTELKLDIKNSSGKTLDEFLLIEIHLPLELAEDRLIAAAEAASRKASNMETLAGVVTVTTGWSVWAFKGRTESVATIRILNDTDQETGEELNKPIEFKKDASFTLVIPVNEQASITRGEIPYGYLYTKKGARVDDTIILIPTDDEVWEPDVSFTTSQPNPTMIPKLGTPVEIRWKIKDAVSANLRGPIPGGNSEVTLTTNRASQYWMEDGRLTFLAVGLVIYMLDVEVNNPETNVNVRVIKTLMFDLKSSEKYARLKVHPGRVLPNGLFDIDWAVWGVNRATLQIGNDYGENIELTEQNLSHHFQGSGVWRFGAQSEPGREDITLNIYLDPTEEDKKKGHVEVAEDKYQTSIDVAKWMSKQEVYKQPLTGKSVGMAVAIPKLALLTTEGLWIATVGERDSTGPDTYSFSKVETDKPKAWLGIVAFEKGFVALRQTDSDELQLARYSSEGKPDGLAVDLPGTVRALLGQSDTVFDLVAFGKRVYVVVEATVSNAPTRHAFSVGFKSQAERRDEPVLKALAQHRLLTFDDGLYALNRSTGKMLRFDLDKKGDLEPPRKAAAAIDSGNSIIKQGLMIPVGGILLVLDPTSTPTLRSLQNFMREDTSEAVENTRSQVYQDLIYNPQQDEWAPCGHGLNIEEGAIAAFREGSSPRLWVLQPNRKMHTLTGAYEHLFAPNYVPPGSRSEKYPSKPLPPMMDGKREVTIINQSGTDLVPVDDACRAAGIYSFSATGMADVTPMLRDKLANETRKTFAISYDKDKPAVVTMRFMVADHSSPHYLLELTFSGSDLSAVTSVFKGMASDGQITEIPETLINHPANNIITVPRAARLVDNMRLFIINTTNEYMTINPWEGNSRLVTNSSTELAFNYATPSFQITMPRMEKVGALRANFDLARPLGIEASSGSEAQRSMVRFDTTNSYMLDARVQVLKAGAPPFEYEMRDGTKASIPTQSTDSVVCSIGFKTKMEFDGVLLGDAVISTNGESLYIPLAKTQKPANDRILDAEIWRVDTDGFGYSRVSIESKGGVWAKPNTIAVTDDKVYAMFNPEILQESDLSLQSWKNSSFAKKKVSAMTTTDDGSLCIGMRSDTAIGLEGNNVLAYYDLWVRQPLGKQFTKNIDRDFTSANSDNALISMAVSPDGTKLAVFYKGMVQLTDVLTGALLYPVRTRNSDVTHMIFSKDSVFFYCANASRSSRDEYRDLTVTCIRFKLNTKDVKDIKLTDGKSQQGLTIESTQKLHPPQNRRTPFDRKNVPFTLAISPDNRELFVSAGKMIMKIDTETFTLRPWRTEVELPCRLISVGKGYGNK
ncbi:MAG TPA: hypothetical protein VLR90_04815, partial [Blastocatellia bacterium]|nr:hypothetical protein [Blastocatellia bacterium]